MKKLLISLFILISNLSFAQKVDTIIDMGSYKSYYSFSIKAPLLIQYDLYKGGGSCSRKGKNFVGGDLAPLLANNYDYSSARDSSMKVIYQKGHGVPFEDFAYDCEKAQNTFFYWNCFPQTSALNIGAWRSLEDTIRDISHNEHLRILIGGFYDKTVIGNNVHVPYICWKIVYSLDRKEFLICVTYTNSKSPVRKTVKWKDINKMLVKMDVKLDIKKYFKN